MKRLFDDPEFPEPMREDLRRSRAAGHEYDTVGKLSSLQTALSDPTRQPPEADPSDVADVADASDLATATKVGLGGHGIPTAWKLAALIAAGGAGAGLLALPDEHRSAEPPRTTESAQGTPPARADEGPAVEPAATAAQADAHAAGDASRREIAMLVRIRSLLERDPAAAYALAVRAAEEFPNGLLREERTALQVLALAGSGKTTAAREQARAFLASYPESPMRDKVAAVLEP